MTEETRAALTRQLEEARREAAYYRRLAEEGGNRRLRESEELSDLIARLRLVEQDLEKARSELEQRVQERTVELRATNNRLLREIAERGKIEQELRRTNELLGNSEKRYRLLIERIDSPVLVTALTDARVLYINERAAVFFGLSVKEAVGAYVPDYWVYPQERERFIAALVQHGRVSGFEALLRTRTGDQRWVQISANLIDYIDKRASFAVFSDITERKRMEEELRESREEFNNYFMKSMDLLCIADTDGYFRRLNPEWEKTLGFTLPELVGTPFLDLVHPDDVDATMKAVADLEAGREVLNFVNRYRHRDGSHRWIEWRSFAVGKTIYAVARDITDRKQTEAALRESEDKYRRLHESVRDGFGSTDLEGRIIDVNHIYHDMLGYTKEELLGLTYQELTPERWRAYEADIIERQVLVRGYSEVYEKELRRRDGRLVPVELRTYLMRDRTGQPTGYWATIRDITERKRMEEERLQLERRLLEAQKIESLGLMAGGIAHDFNNLLAAILGNLELALLRLPKTTSAHSRLERALQATCRATHLTHQMLAYSGKGRFLIARMDLNELMREKADLIRAVVPRTATLSFCLTDEPSMIEADPGQVEQVIMNLISNAAEAIGERPGTITLTTGVQDCDEAYLRRSRLDEKPARGRFVYVEVADTGCGMDEQAQQRLFDPFFTTKFLGRGLGMSAVLGIVRGHKGAIIVESAVGAGSSIRVLFRACPEESGGAKEVPGERSSPSNSPSDRRTVLVVDDEEAIREVGAAVLESIGFQSIAAANGEEALRLFKQHADELACVLLDLTMPRMDGVSAFREMMSVRADVPVILCSGLAEEEATQRFGGQGLAGFIQKPYHLQTLKDELARVLQSFGKTTPDDESGGP